MNPNKIEDLPNLLKVLTFAQKFNQQSVYLSFIDETMLNQYCEAKYMRCAIFKSCIMAYLYKLC